MPFKHSVNIMALYTANYFGSIFRDSLRLLCIIATWSFPRVDADTVECSVRVTVDQSAGDHIQCDANVACSDLQVALLKVSRRKIISTDCIDILVTEGKYLITDYITISQSLKLHGKGHVTVHFNFSGKFDPKRTTQPHYVLSFVNTSHVELSGLHLFDSPGIVTAVNISSVTVKNCSFRYTKIIIMPIIQVLYWVVNNYYILPGTL